jgi:hypothetical protein
LAAVNARLDDLERDLTADRLLLPGKINGTHPSLSQHLDWHVWSE